MARKYVFKGLSVARVAAMHYLVDDGGTKGEMARFFGVSRQTVYDTLNRNYWKTVKPEYNMFVERYHAGLSVNGL